MVLWLVWTQPSGSCLGSVMLQSEGLQSSEGSVGQTRRAED